MGHHILVFDSGLGGITIQKEIQAQLPDACYSYLMDNAAFPYGDKSDPFLINRIPDLIMKTIKLRTPDLVVVACNTASTLVLDKLRALTDIPIVGVVPAIKPAACQSESKHIALLATQATVNRQYIDALQDAHAAHCELYKLPTQKLVQLCEDKMLGEMVNIDALEDALSSLKTHAQFDNIDTIILGCTHFPALKEEMNGLWPNKFHWIDSGQAIANRVTSLLGNHSDKPQCTNMILLTQETNEAKLSKIRHATGFNEHSFIKID